MSMRDFFIRIRADPDPDPKHSSGWEKNSDRTVAVSGSATLVTSTVHHGERPPVIPPPRSAGVPGALVVVCTLDPDRADRPGVPGGPVQVQMTLSSSSSSRSFPVSFQVFLVLWWWFTLLCVIGFVRLVYRFIQCR